MSATPKVDQMISTALYGLAKARAFRRKGRTMRRRLGETQQLVNVQLSTRRVPGEGRFYVNVGVGFDALWRLELKADFECPKVEQAHYSRRIGHLVAEAPEHFTVSEATDIAGDALQLHTIAEQLFDRLDAIDGPASMLAALPLDVGSELILRARLRYVLDDRPAALADLRAASAFFADRRNMSVADLIARHRLEGLQELA